MGERLAVVQDDANFIALVDPRTALATSVTLGAGPGGARQFDDGRGNKADKLDLEAIVCVAGHDGAPMVVAFGSGSTKRRERVVMVSDIAVVNHENESESHPDRTPVRGVHARALYQALRAARAFSGSELNMEGVVLEGTGDARVLHLFNRGNGDVSRGARPVNASCEMPWDAVRAYLEHADRTPPALRSVVQYDLGTVDGHALGCTDTALLPPGARGGAAGMLYTAAAEDSPDATRNGAVADPQRRQASPTLRALIEHPRSARNPVSARRRPGNAASGTARGSTRRRR